MHKNIPVADVLIDEASGNMVKLLTLHDIHRLPLGMVNEKGSVIFNNLSLWWSERCIPASRDDLASALNKLNIPSIKTLLIKCYGLSLSDQYWIKNINDDLVWDKINYFNNTFSDDIGEIVFGYESKKKNIDFSSPDITSVGNLKKRWKIIDGKRVLVKGSSNPFRQEAVNEVVADVVLDILNIPHIHYSLVWHKEVPYSLCEDFIDENSDFIPAYQVSKIINKNNSDSVYTHLIKCYKKLEITDAEYFLNKMIVFDFIIANEDRHFNNFGIIRDVNNINQYKIAPLFDNGSSLGFNKINDDIEPFKNIESKPFKEKPLEQLKLVSSFDFLTKESLLTIKDAVYICLTKYQSKYLTKERIEKICDSLDKRVQYLLKKL